MQTPRPYTHTRQGFTLVELSIVIIIIGLLTAGGLAAGTKMVERAAYIDTRKTIEQLQETLKHYYIVQGRLPCPANISVAPTSSSFGVEQSCGSSGVRVGGVPTRALGLPDSMAADKFGSRIVYAVSQSLTNANNFGSGSDAITVQDVGGSVAAPNAAYVLASMGRDRKGARIHNTGALPRSCGSTANLDTLNCTLTSSEFRDAPFNNGEVANRFFDDVVGWAPKFHFTAFDTQSNALWALRAGTQHIFAVGTDGNPATTNVGIGTSTPAESLHTTGNIRTDGQRVYFGEEQNLYGSGTTLYMTSNGTSSNLLLRDEANATVLGLTGSSTSAKIAAGGSTRMTFLGGERKIIHLYGGEYGRGYLGLFGALNSGAGATIFMFGADEGGAIYSTASTTLTSSSKVTHFWKRGSGTTGTTLMSLYADGHLSYLRSPVVSSDRRLKTDIHPVENALDKLEKLKGVSFLWQEDKGNTDAKRTLGVIAQDVQAVFPELVTTNDNDYLSVNMDGFVAPLIQAVNELRTRQNMLLEKADASPTPEATSPGGTHLSALLWLLIAVSFALMLKTFQMQRQINRLRKDMQG